MITTIEPNRYFHVTGTTPEEVNASINAAVEMAREHATGQRWQGILLTRHRPDFYTVSVSPDAPFGVTLEREG